MRVYGLSMAAHRHAAGQRLTSISMFYTRVPASEYRRFINLQNAIGLQPRWAYHR